MTLEEILKFIEISNSEINYNKKSDLKLFGERFIFNSEESIDLFKLVLDIWYETGINLYISEVLNDSGFKNKELLKILPKSNERFLISNYDIGLMHKNWDEISGKIKYQDGFKFEGHVLGRMIIHLLFKILLKERGTTNNKFKAKDFYQVVSQKLHGDTNYSREIEIFYSLKDYIDNKFTLHPILEKLEDLEILKIKNIIVKEGYIYFYLEKFTEFTLEKVNLVFEKLNGIDMEVEYKKGEIYINGKKISFKDKDSKIYNIFNLSFESFKHFNKNKVTIPEVEEIYLKNIENYSNLSKNDFKDVDKTLRKSIQTKNKSLDIEDFIGISKSGIECQYYIPEILI